MITYSVPAHISVPDLSDFFTNGHDHDGLVAAETVFRNELSKWAKARGAHTLAGKFVSVPFADGVAEYCIVKFNNKVSLIHVPLGDAWQDGRFERTVTVAELTRMVASKKKLAALFAKA